MDFAGHVDEVLRNLQVTTCVYAEKGDLLASRVLGDAWATIVALKCKLPLPADAPPVETPGDANGSP